MLIKCPACEHDVSDKAIRCNKCGEPINGNNNTTVATPQGKSPATLSYIIIVVIFIIGIVVFFGELNHFGDLKDQVDQINEMLEGHMRFMQSIMEGIGY